MGDTVGSHLTYRIVILCIIILFIMTGCVQTVQDDNRYIKPVPIDGKVLEIPKEEIGVQTLSLYYPSADLEGLRREFRDVNIEAHENKVSAILQLLLKEDVADIQKENEKDGIMYNQSLVFGGMGEIKWTVVSRGLAVVDIIGDFSTLSEQMMFVSTIAVVNTLTEFPEIQYVKLSLNGEDQGGKGILSNPLLPMGDDLRPLWLEHQSYLSSQASRKSDATDRNVLYYFDKSGKFLLAEVRSIYHDTQNDVVDIFNELKNGPVNTDEMNPCISKNVTIQGTPEIYENDEGQKTVTLALESPKHEIMDNRTRYMMAGAIVLSIQGQRPDISVVQILLNNEPIIDEARLNSEMFIEYIGNIVPIYFTNDSFERLVTVKRAMSQERYFKPKERVLEILGGVKSYDPRNAVSVFYPEVQRAYVRDVSFYDGIALVNLSSSFPYFTEKGIKTERMIIYAIVNTLCEFENVNRVQFIIDGHRISSLGNLSIENPLLPNPGLTH